MDDLTNRFAKLGRTVAQVSDRAADPTTLPNARRRWLASIPPTEESSRRRVAPWVAFAAACSVAIALLFVLVRHRAPAVSFTVGPQSTPGAVGQWVAPEAEAPLDMRFSEGTVVVVAPGARMRVTETSSSGATLLIERGGIHAAIKHRDASTHWSVQAGPFEVKVTGTAFDARWDPATETFELNMIEGSVIVNGPRLPAGRAVVAGEQLVVSSTRMELRAGAASATTAAMAAPGAAGSASPAACATPPAAPPAATDAAPAGSVAPAPSGTAVADAARSEPSWRALARSGKYKDAMDAAEAAGFSAEVARASSSDLMALADTARFAGRPARAKEALLAMRRRFGARGSSAFLLGKIAADQQGSPGEAVTWFETYLQEEPGGPLAEQALGRVLEIRKRDPGAARPVAERYLARYPNGAYAALARSLVGR
jgi:hypothetical protein